MLKKVWTLFHSPKDYSVWSNRINDHWFNISGSCVGCTQLGDTLFASALARVSGKTEECWLHMIIHLDYYEHLAHFLFFFISSAWYGRGNQPHRASSAATLRSRSDYNLGWLDCLQSHSENQASWMLAKWPFGIIHLPSRRDLAPCLRHYVEASVCCVQCGLLDSWKLWASSGREAAF